MDRNNWVLTLVLFLHLIYNTSGEIPINVSVHMWEGNVTVTWVPPQENPVGCLYQVQLSDTDYPGVWVNVSHCTLLKETICNIGHMSTLVKFDVRVGILMNQHDISWSYSKANNIRDSQLLAPTFSLSSTSSSVQINVHLKQGLEELFPYGLQYIAYLWQEGQENKTLMKTEEDTEEIIFSSLQYLQVYCVRVKVESVATIASNNSPVQCIKLPLDPVILISCLLILGFLGFSAVLLTIVHLFKHQREMPNALKLTLKGWRPMILGPVEVETVTDKGWFLINQNAKPEMQTSEEKDEFEDDKERRESLDSGVSMEQIHLSNNSSMTEGQLGDLLVDSGCGSLKETDGCERAGKNTAKTKMKPAVRSEGEDDSGLGLSHHEADSSERYDCGLLSEVVVGDGYRSQSPSNVDEVSKARGMEMHTAVLSCGYRVDRIPCLCSEQETCIWCTAKKALTHDCQPLIEGQSEFTELTMQANDGCGVISNYLKKSMEHRAHILNVEGEDTLVSPSGENHNDSAAHLLSCTPQLQDERIQVNEMDKKLFTLDDVQLIYS